jgi:hypothetical protein
MRLKKGRPASHLRVEVLMDAEAAGRGLRELCAEVESVGPVAPKVSFQLFNDLLCYSILLYNLLISPHHRTLRYRDITDIRFLNDDQELTY